MMKRTPEEQAIVLMKLFTNWLEFWIEDVKEDPAFAWEHGREFGITQIEGLQRCLERVKKKLKEGESGY